MPCERDPLDSANLSAFECELRNYCVGACGVINPRREGYSSRSVSVCLSVCRRLFSHYRLRGGL